MTWHERALTFNCQGEQLFGVLATPSDQSRATGTGVLVVVGGPQYRVGAHRQFVQFARALAAAGHSVLRFDVRGMGDSTGAQRTFEELDADIDAGLCALEAAAPEAGRLVMMGLCDGASAAWLRLDSPTRHRVSAVCVANPWVRTQASLAQTQVKHYYTQRLRQPEFWRKLFTGGVGAAAVKSVLQNLQLAVQKHRAPGQTAPNTAPFPDRMARACLKFAGPQLIVLSELDLTAKEFAGQLKTHLQWGRAASSPSIEVAELTAADHTFTGHKSRSEFEALVLGWLARSVVTHTQ